MSHRNGEGLDFHFKNYILLKVQDLKSEYCLKLFDIAKILFFKPFVGEFVTLQPSGR